MEPTVDLEKQADSAARAVSNPSPLDLSSAPTPKYSNNCNFAWKNISYSVDTPAGKKQILQNINGCVEKGLLL
jgi:hypothetical protein